MATINQIGLGLSGASGTGSFAGTVSPSFTTPVLGTPSSGTLSSCTGYATASLTGLGTGVATALASGVSGSGNIALVTSPTFVTPALGTPSSGNLSNCTGVPTTGFVLLSPSGDQVIVGNFTLGTYNLTASNQLIAADIIISGDTIQNNTTNHQVNIIAVGTSLVSIGTALLFAPAASGTQKYIMQVAQLNVDASVGIGSFTATANGGILNFTKSRNTSPGSHAGINNGDSLGTILFNGDDAASYLPGAQIQVTATTGVTTGHIPAQMVFSTSSASTANVTAMTISNAQVVTLANALPVTSGGTGVTSSTGSTNVVLSTSPTITTPRIITSINDSSGNTMLGLTEISAAVNHLTIENNATGGGTTLYNLGSDADIPMTIQTKGAGALTLAIGGNSAQLIVSSGVSHTTNFSFPVSATTIQTITFPDASGTVALVGGAVPTIQQFTSGTGTYTKPAKATCLVIEMVGGGGGGAGTGAGSTAGSNGNDSTFGASATAEGGSSGSSGNGGGVMSATIGIGGNPGSVSGGIVNSNGGGGGSSYYGGSGQGGLAGFSDGASAYVNSGSGGGGGGGGTAIVGGTGGGAAGYVYLYITSPSATYAYGVGSGGAGGSAGTGGRAGGSGAAGMINVFEYYV